MEPGTEYEVEILLPPTSNLFAAGHRIRIDVSSSNFPRLERNPNTGEPIGRHTHDGRRRADASCTAARVVLPVIPARDRLGRRSRRGRSRWGDDRGAPSRPTRTRRRGASSRSTRSGIARVPVTTGSHGDGVPPVDATSRATRREAFCDRRACGCRPRSSGRRRRAAATTGSGRGATSCPTRRARRSRRASAGRSPVGLHPAGRVAVRRARHGRQRLRVDGRTASCAAARTSSGAGRAALLGAPADAPGARATTTSASASSPSSRAAASTGSTCPAASTRSAATPASRGSGVVDVAAFELVAHAGHERAVRARSSPRPARRRRRTGPRPRDHPVTFVDWHEASRVLRLGGGRLPTEAEWEKAARGTDGAHAIRGATRRTRAARRSARGLKHGTTAPVGAHPAGASPYGLLDMAGNVWEWTATDVPAGRARAARRLVREPRPRVGALRDAQPQPAGAPAGAHRLPRRERRER